MSDIALRWDVYAADLAIEAGGLAIDDGLETAVILSAVTAAGALRMVNGPLTLRQDMARFSDGVQRGMRDQNSDCYGTAGIDNV